LGPHAAATAAGQLLHQAAAAMVQIRTLRAQQDLLTLVVVVVVVVMQLPETD